MELVDDGHFLLTMSDRWNHDFYQRLKQTLRSYNRISAPDMEAPEPVPLNIAVHDTDGVFVGGIAALTYWGWLVIKLLVLDEAARGNGIGQRLLQMAHAEGWRRGCTCVQTMTYDFQALTFYLQAGYQIVGELQNYPAGHGYFWLQRELTEDESLRSVGEDYSSTVDLSPLKSPLHPYRVSTVC